MNRFLLKYEITFYIKFIIPHILCFLLAIIYFFKIY